MNEMFIVTVVSVVKIVLGLLMLLTLIRVFVTCGQVSAYFKTKDGKSIPNTMDTKLQRLVEKQDGIIDGLSSVRQATLVTNQLLTKVTTKKKPT